MTRSLRDRALDLLFPEPLGCHLCGEPSGEALLCPACRSQLYRSGPVQCRHCGRTLGEGGLCRACREYGLETLCSGMEILYRYEGSARQAVHLAKFESRRAAAKLMAHLLAQQVERMPIRPEAILFVPSHPLRTLMRGYCSMEYTALELGRLTGIPVERQALRRVRYSAPMYTGDHAQRKLRARSAFAPGRMSRSYSRLLLIDDVCTSGATIHACLEALHAPDAVTVMIFAGAGESPLDGSADL